MSPLSPRTPARTAKAVSTRLRTAATFASPPPTKRPPYYRAAPHPPSLEVSELLSKYASITSARPLNLYTLLSFARPLTPESVLASVNYALTEIPRRLALRVRSLEALPFIVGTNPYVASTLNAYRESFLWVATHPPVTNLDQNAKFAEQLADLVQSHANDIPTMAKGFQECSRYMSPTQISNFLDGAIRNRISVRLIAEQHIALSQALENPDANSSHVGVVDLECSPKAMVKMCGSFVSDLCEATLGTSPSIVINGHTDATFAYVPVHLEYMLTEILKNAFRATVEHHMKHHPSSRSLPPVTITLSSPSAAMREAGHPYFSLRIRDQGGGVSQANMARIFSYAFTTAGRRAEEDVDDGEGGGPYAAQHVGGSAAIGSGGLGEANLFGEITGKGLQTGIGTIAGLGYGLPMSQLYAKYFGGSLELMSLEGWGTDVFLKLRCLDEAGDVTV
ncbi:putative 26S proteasome subunit P45 [Lyophyllum shimeji]|uniref:Protein-serine/threonine kinase n=1 Tax=Lyophyllum shimeji TaxID=47721 RepID=A0A9P3PGR0_LYOSH|nr:putative 26S proteasome subunit P45 [Lyophyllum shimeji]